MVKRNISAASSSSSSSYHSRHSTSLSTSSTSVGNSPPSIHIYRGGFPPLPHKQHHHHHQQRNNSTFNQRLNNNNNPNNDDDDEDYEDVNDKEPKSSIIGATFNLCNNIVGAGIIGIPFAIAQCSLVIGVVMIVVFGWMTVKSLRMLIESAKRVNVPTYERLAEAAFGKSGKWIT